MKRKNINFVAWWSIIFSSALFLQLAHAQNRQFGYLHALSDLNSVVFDSSHPNAKWSTLSHGALDADANWAVFATPAFGISSYSDTHNEAVSAQHQVSYSIPFQKYLISYSGVNVSLPISNLYFIGAIENNASSVITLNNISIGFDSPAPFYIDHPLLNNHPEAVPVFSFHCRNGLTYGQFVFDLDYDAAMGKWYIYPLNGNFFSGGTPTFDFYIQVAQAEVNGFRALLPPSSATVPCRVGSQCVPISHPLINGNPDAILIASSSNSFDGSQNGFRYDPFTQRWQIECEQNSAPIACHILGASTRAFYIWVPSAGEVPTSKTMALVESNNTTERAITNSYIFTKPLSMAQMVVSTQSPDVNNNAQTILNFDSFNNRWLVSLLNFGDFTTRTQLSVHNFLPKQNAYLHKVNTSTTALFSQSLIDHALLNGRDSFFVTQAVYNPFALGTPAATFLSNTGLYWNGTYWYLRIESSSLTPTLTPGSYYHVLIPERYQSAGEPLASIPRAFRHQANSGNVLGNCTRLDNEFWLDRDPNARIYFNHVIRDPSSTQEIYIDSSFYVTYDPILTGHWFICRSDGNGIPIGAKFNVIVYSDSDVIFPDQFE